MLGGLVTLGLVIGCANVLDMGQDGAGAQTLPPNQEAVEPWQGVPTDADGGLAPGDDAGAVDGPADGGSPGGQGAGSCQVWSDCGPFYGDPNSGYACESGTCLCDPAGNAAQNCLGAGGTFDQTLCYCQLPNAGPTVGGSCQQWQDCAPHFGDQNSGFECQNATCVCDPDVVFAGRCQSYGGYWIVEECFCAFTDQAVPDEDPGAGCYWHWEAPPCDPDRWVDTSRYEEQCGYDANDQWRCESVWVTSGYWEPGACPSGHWERRC